MKKVLFVTSEAVPFIKTGGLADVTGSLPKYFDKKKKYYIYCVKGVKSKRVTAILEAYGYNVTRVTD